MDQPLTLFEYFRSFQTFYRRGIRTRIVWVEGEYADHYTTTTTSKALVTYNLPMEMSLTPTYFTQHSSLLSNICSSIVTS